jgi:hypothetical protein
MNTLNQPDYPAAHSMDTHWFAVDERGQVAVFATGEDGHVPKMASGDDGDLFRLASLYRAAEDKDEDRVEEQDAELLGMYFYDYSYGIFEPIEAYRRSQVPKVPLHIDQLPPDFRAMCISVKFPFRFDETDTVQPLESFPCVYWYEAERVSFLCADGKTIRPIPGQEDRFAEFVRELCQGNPELADKYHFEGPTE